MIPDSEKWHVHEYVLDMIYKEQRTRLKYYCANSGPSGHSKNGPTVSWMHPHDAKNPDFLCQALHAQNRPRIGFFLDTFLRPRSDSKMNPKPCQESSKIFTKIVPKPIWRRVDHLDTPKMEFLGPKRGWSHSLVRWAAESSGDPLSPRIGFVFDTFLRPQTDSNEPKIVPSKLQNLHKNRPKTDLKGSKNRSYL